MSPLSVQILDVEYERGRADALREAAELCDRVAQSKPDNRKARNPLATYRSGAATCAWQIRQLAKETP